MIPLNHQKRKAKKLLLFLFLFFFVILVVIFFQSSLSRIQVIQVFGTERLTDDEVIALSEIELGDQILLLRESTIKERLLQNPIIKDATLEINFPGNVNLHISEYETVAYLLNDQLQLQPVLANGYVFDHAVEEVIDHPIITKWDDLNLLPNMCSELLKLNALVLGQISEIRHIPTDNDPYKLVLYMRDGYEVQTSMIQFADHLKKYMYVVENLEEQAPGVIYLNDAGIYFTSYEVLQEYVEQASNEEEETVNP